MLRSRDLLDQPEASAVLEAHRSAQYSLYFLMLWSLFEPLSGLIVLQQRSSYLSEPRILSHSEAHFGVCCTDAQLTQDAHRHIPHTV
jgi:hypothetical protein